MKQVILMRGLPGSGKSTYIKKNFPQATIISTDLFFTDSQGNFKYDPSKIQQAHGTTFRKYIEVLQRGDSLIVVDNTNTGKWEISPYMLGALAFGYQAQIITLLCDPEISKVRNIHNVPSHIIDRMNFVINTELLLNSWPHTILKSSNLEQRKSKQLKRKRTKRKR